MGYLLYTPYKQLPDYFRYVCSAFYSFSHMLFREQGDEVICIFCTRLPCWVNIAFVFKKHLLVDLTNKIIFWSFEGKYDESR